MTAALDRIVVPATDKGTSAQLLATILGVPVQPPWGPFLSVRVANGVTLDFVDGNGFSPQHCAFLVSEDEFDAAYARLLDARVPIWADPGRTRPGEINHRHGGRGICFDDPDGHLMEILTRPYGPEPE